MQQINIKNKNKQTFRFEKRITMQKKTKKTLNKSVRNSFSEKAKKDRSFNQLYNKYMNGYFYETRM